eukprot:6021856-Amphidinium_carterae.1
MTNRVSCCNPRTYIIQQRDNNSLSHTHTHSKAQTRIGQTLKPGIFEPAATIAMLIQRSRKATVLPTIELLTSLKVATVLLTNHQEYAHGANASFNPLGKRKLDLKLSSNTILTNTCHPLTLKHCNTCTGNKS